MIIWGGSATSGGQLNTGGRYDPDQDTWAAMSMSGAPSPRYVSTAVWTGTEMIIWGGRILSSVTYFNTGARYSPASDTWTATTTTAAPSGRIHHTAVWTGSEMIIWGGSDSGLGPSNVNSGARYHPTDDTWTTMSTTDAPLARTNFQAVWTGTEMIIWGGSGELSDFLNSGGVYNPICDTWAAMSTIDAPLPRYNFTAVWTGMEMIIWGGYVPGYICTDTGGRYR